MTNSPTPTTPPTTPPRRRRFGMSLRDMVILLVSIAGGVGAGFLLAGAALPLGQAVLGGFTAFAATLFFLDRIIEVDDSNSQ